MTTITRVLLGALACVPVLACTSCVTPGDHLIFGQTHTVGINVSGSAASGGAEFTLGYKDRNVAIVPVMTTNPDGGKIQLSAVGEGDIDAFSVLGQFSVGAETGTSSATNGGDGKGQLSPAIQVGLGKFFATGIAARNLADGFAMQMGYDFGGGEEEDSGEEADEGKDGKDNKEGAPTLRTASSTGSEAAEGNAGGGRDGSKGNKSIDQGYEAEKRIEPWQVVCSGQNTENDAEDSSQQKAVADEKVALMRRAVLTTTNATGSTTRANGGTISEVPDQDDRVKEVRTKPNGPTRDVPLIFGQAHAVGIGIAGSATEPGEFTLGYKDRDLAIVPLTMTDKDGTKKQLVAKTSVACDAFSVLGQFSVKAGRGTSSKGPKGPNTTSEPESGTRVTLGKFFATGLAARSLAMGFQSELNELKEAGKSVASDSGGGQGGQGGPGSQGTPPVQPTDPQQPTQPPADPATDNSDEDGSDTEGEGGDDDGGDGEGAEPESPPVPGAE